MISPLSYRLVSALPLVADARLRASARGTEAVLELDSALIRARAEQQGLPDRSDRAAAECPRVQRMIQSKVAALNDELEASQRIVRCRILGRAGHPLADFVTA